MNKIKKFSSFILSFLLLILALGSNSFTISSAGMFCKDTIGDGLTEKAISSAVKDSELPSLGNRIYTVDELFANSFTNAIPIGTIKKGTFFLSENDKVEKKVTLSNEQKERLEKWGEQQNSFECTVGHKLSNFLTNMTTSIGQAMTSFVQKFPMSLFSNDFICNPDAGKTTGCLNILGIVAGKDNSDKTGLISKFGTGFFIPLQALAFVTVGVWGIYKGLFKREFRATLNGFLWALFALFLGMCVVLKPYTFARLPQLITTGISDCLMGAMTGAGCTLGTPTPEAKAGSVCYSYSSEAKTGNSLAMKVNGLACGMTKSFNLDRWAQQQFGYSFDELWTSGAPTGFSVLPQEKYHGNANEYCVNMGSSLSPDEINGSPKMTTEPRCNIALAFLAKRTQGDYGVKASMEQFVATAAKDDTMWAAFTGQDNKRTGVWGIFSNLGILLTAVAFIPTTVYAHAYSLTATILMAFAPLFFLFGIHPGKGKKIFLGWLESIVGSILKYVASAMLTLIMILMFGSALSTMTAIQAFIAVIILDVTFLMYRKELVNLIGAVNMGGQKVSNRAAEALGKVQDNVSQYAQAGLGGAGAGLLTAHQLSKNNEGTGAKQVLSSIKDVVTGKEGASLSKVARTAGEAIKDNTVQVAKGTAAGLGMEARRGNGVVATAARQFNMSNQKLKKARNDKLQKQMDEETKHKSDYNNKQDKSINMSPKIQEPLYDLGLENLSDDIEKGRLDISNLSYDKDKDGTKLSELSSEFEVKVERTEKVVSAIDQTKALSPNIEDENLISESLKNLANKEAMSSINRTEVNFDNIIHKLQTLHKNKAISDEDFQKLSKQTYNLQTEILEDSSIKFENDMVNSFDRDTRQIDPTKFHEAWNQFEENQRRTQEKLRQINYIADEAIKDFGRNPGNLDISDSMKARTFVHRFDQVTSEFTSFEEEMKQNIHRVQQEASERQESSGRMPRRRRR